MHIYKAIVVPILIYTLLSQRAPARAQQRQLDVLNNNCLRRILHERLGPEVISNADLYAKFVNLRFVPCSEPAGSIG